MKLSEKVAKVDEFRKTMTTKKAVKRVRWSLHGYYAARRNLSKAATAKSVVFGSFVVVDDTIRSIILSNYSDTQKLAAVKALMQ